MILFLIDPAKQFNKAKDSQRKDDFRQIRTALDTYYNDFSCYPNSIPYGTQWRVGQTVYMKQVPQDPGCGSDGSKCYSYIVDPSNPCPQWHVLFGKLAVSPSADTPACLLQTSCLPSNFSTSGYNYCDFGGNIDCDTLQTIVLPSSPGGGSSPTSPTPTSGSNGGAPTPTDIILPTPTSPSNPTATPIPPTPTPTIDASQGVYYCGCGNSHVTVCNVTFTIPSGVTYYLDRACNNQCGQSC